MKALWKMGLFVSGALVVGAGAAQAQGAAQVGEVVVTGSRIRAASDTATPAPVAVIDASVVQDQGFVQIGQALNETASIAPSFVRTNPGSPVDAMKFPNLFGLGAGRTLTLVNGRRMVTASSGLEDSTADNFPDKLPSFTYAAGYGDSLGRQYFAGIRARL